MYFLKKYYLILKGMVLMTKEGSTKSVNFMTSGAGVFVQWHGHISQIVKMHHFF